jgi:hypothetical protein
MGRLEKYRNIRQNKKRIIGVVIICLLLTGAGICAVDRSVNSLMLDNNSINIISFRNTENSLDICFLNKTLCIDRIFPE